MRGLLPFFGVRTAGASDEDLHRGRRRVVALTGFLTFILAVAAATSQNWVSGGLEYTFTSLAEAPLCESCGLSAPSLGATVRIEFALGLSQLGQSTEYDYPYTGERATRDCIFDVEPYIRNINAAAVSNDTSPRNIWYGAEPIPVGKFNSTLGLLGFAAFLMLISWITIVSVQYGVPRISTSKASLWTVRGLGVAVTFFLAVAVINFGASAIKAEFCKAFDPDAAFLGLPCGFGSAFGCAIAAIVFALLHTLAAFLHMGLDLPQSYGFSGAGSSGLDGAGLGAKFGGSASAASYEPVETPLTASASGGYQG